MMEYLKNHWLEISAFIIAIISSIIAYFTWHSSFLLTHRPFLWVENFGYINEQNVVISPINITMTKILNSPAQITYEKYYYYIKEGNNIRDIDNKITENQSIKYPDDKMQYTYAANLKQEIADNLKNTEELIRTIRIEYKWLSSRRKYFFEGQWVYNKENKTWDIIYQKAN